LQTITKNSELKILFNNLRILSLSSIFILYSSVKN